MQARWSSKGDMPEYGLSTNRVKSLTNDNALTELAVRSSLSGRFCDAGCNTTPPQCATNARKCNRTAVHKAEAPWRRLSTRPYQSARCVPALRLPLRSTHYETMCDDAHHLALASWEQAIIVVVRRE